MNWDTVVILPVSEMLTRVAGFFPTLIGVVVILVVGWIIASVLNTGAVRMLKIIQLDTAGEKAGVGDFLRRGGINASLSELIGGLVYWLIMLMVFMTALNALGMTIAASLLDKVILYIPNVIAGIFILALGLFFANLIGTIVRTTTINAGISQAKFLGQVTQVLIIIFAVIVALDQLKIAVSVLYISLNIILGSVGLAFALAVGIGSKDIAGKMIQELINKLKTK